MRTHKLANAPRFRVPVLPQHEGARRAQVGDALANLFGSFFAKGWERRKTPIARRELELLQRIEPQSVVDEPNACWSESRHTQHFEQSFRRVFLQAFEQGGPIRLDDIDEHGASSWCDTIERGRFISQYVSEGLVSVGAHRARGGVHRAHTEAILVVQFEEGGDLGQCVRNASAVHSGIYLSSDRVERAPVSSRHRPAFWPAAPTRPAVPP